MSIILTTNHSVHSQCHYLYSQLCLRFHGGENSDVITKVCLLCNSQTNQLVINDIILDTVATEDKLFGNLLDISNVGQELGLF